MAETGEVVTSRPVRGDHGSQGRAGGSADDIEHALASILGDVHPSDRAGAESHFFDDLGADSMVMARFCARVRKRPDLPPVSMRDIYRHPSVRSLATALAEATPTVDRPADGAEPAGHPPTARATATAGSTWRYVCCGALQLLTFLVSCVLTSVVLTRTTEWVFAAPGLLAVYLRSVTAGAVLFAALCVVPIALKWLLVGRWRTEEFPIWGPTYFRFWLVRALVRANPLVLFSGSPLFVLYLRALGARIGRGVVVLSPHVPVCTDLLTIGEGTVVRKDAYFSCYRAHHGTIQTGTVTIGRNACVGEATVLDIGTSIGDGGQLGHASSLQSGQSIPDGESWHGSPARPTDVDFRAVAPRACGTFRRAVYAVRQLLPFLLVYLPVSLIVTDMLFAETPHVVTVLGSGPLDTSSFWRDALVVTTVALFGGLLVTLLVLYLLPRLVGLAFTPDKVYPLYGVHYSLHRTVARLTNLKYVMRIFGDSSYITGYLRLLGYDLTPVEQTGSNFGTEVRHETPSLVSVGTGTMVADGLSVINAHFSSSSFRVSRASIGPRNFLGNKIAYHSDSRTGENCLLATKVMVPLDGEVRRDVGLLGSPAFEIPRSVERDSRFDLPARERRRRLRKKNRYNLRTIAWFLALQWIHLLGLVVLGMATSDLYRALGVGAVALEIVAVTLYTTTFFVLVERGVAGFRPLSPQFCSIYDRYFWWHERYWKSVIPDSLDKRFTGTPFKNLVSRALGVRLGRRVYDDGCFFPERTLVTVGDDCTLNTGSVVQCHSQEDGTFKSDRSTLGAGATLGVAAFVHYGVAVGDGAVLAADSFLMKGEDVPAHARWVGNPAQGSLGLRALDDTALPIPADGRP